MYNLQEKMTFLLRPYEEMFKLNMETFSYFVRWFLSLILSFYQVNKTGHQKLIRKCRCSRLYNQI